MRGQKEELRKKKEYLRGYRKARERQDAIEEELKKVREDCNVPESLRTDTARDGGGKKRDLSDYFAKIEKIEDELEERYKETVEKRCELAKKIDEISISTERYVIEKHYIYGKTFKEIAEELAYSERHVMRLHEKALKKIKMS